MATAESDGPGLDELLAFLGPDARSDVRAEAARSVLALSGDAAGRRLLCSRPDCVAALLALDDDGGGGGAREALLGALVNLAADPAAHGPFQPALPLLVRRLLLLLEPDGPSARLTCAVLRNLARSPASCRQLLAALQGEAGGLASLLEALCARRALPGLAPLLASLCQLPEARAFLLDKDRCAVQRLLPYTQDASSSLRRAGVVATLRNCCFDYEHHAWLLSDQVDVLPFLLLPLAGPEEFPEDEMERLPVDLQYLPPEKQREPDPDIRKMLLEAILLLTATKPGRQVVRQKGTYFVLRELHKWETDPGVLVACEKLIQVLIGDEPEPGMENLLEVEIPAEIEEQLQRLDQEEEQNKQTTCSSQALER